MGVLLPSTTGALITSAIGMAMSLIPYKKNLFDLSTQGTDISILGFVGEETMTVELSKFADDKDAIEIKEIELNEVTTSYNGKLINVGKIPKYRVTVSLIPHSKNDVDMAKLANACTFKRMYDTSLGAKEKGYINMYIHQIRIDEQAAAFQLIGVGGAKTAMATACFEYGQLVSSSAISNRGATNHGAETTASREGRHTASVYEFEFTQCFLDM